MEPLPLNPLPPEGSHKKVIYFVRHAEATHNVKEREAIQAAIAAGETNKERQDQARRAVLNEDPSLKDAPLSQDGTQQARTSGKKLAALFNSSPQSSPPLPLSRRRYQSGGAGGGGSSSPGHRSTHSMASSSMESTLSGASSSSRAPFRRPDVVLVPSPLRRALMTATELFFSCDHGQDPPMFLAIEALREKTYRIGL